MTITWVGRQALARGGDDAIPCMVMALFRDACFFFFFWLAAENNWDNSFYSIGISLNHQSVTDKTHGQRE